MLGVRAGIARGLMLFIELLGNGQRIGRRQPVDRVGLPLQAGQGVEQRGKLTTRART
jgi:hypothetical protein